MVKLRLRSQGLNTLYRAIEHLLPDQGVVQMKDKTFKDVNSLPFRQALCNKINDMPEKEFEDIVQFLVDFAS